MGQDRLLYQYERNKKRLEQAQSAVKKRGWSASFTGAALSIIAALGGAIGGLALEATTNFTKETVPPLFNALSCYVQDNLHKVEKAPSRYTVVVLPFANDKDGKATNDVAAAFRNMNYVRMVRPCVQIAPASGGDFVEDSHYAENRHVDYVRRISGAFQKYGADLIVFGAVEGDAIKINGANQIDLDRAGWPISAGASSLSTPGSSIREVHKGSMDGVANDFLDRITASIINDARRMGCSDTMVMRCSYVDDKDSLKSLYDLINKALDVYSILDRAGVVKEEKYGPFVLSTYALVRDTIIARAQFDGPFPEEQQYRYIPRQWTDEGEKHFPIPDAWYRRLKEGARLHHMEESNLAIGDALLNVETRCTRDYARYQIATLRKTLEKLSSDQAAASPSEEVGYQLREPREYELAFAQVRGTILFTRIAEIAFALAESDNDRQDMKDRIAETTELLGYAKGKLADVGVDLPQVDNLKPPLPAEWHIQSVSMENRLAMQLSAVQKVATTLTPSYSASDFAKSFELIRPKGCSANAFPTLGK